jgi:hypothetical protein
MLIKQQHKTWSYNFKYSISSPGEPPVIYLMQRHYGKILQLKNMLFKQQHKT